MASTGYPYGPGTYDTDQLRTEIIAAGLPAPTDMQGSGYPFPGAPATSVTIFFDPALTVAQKTTLDGVVAGHAPAGPRKSRTVLAIYNNILALTTAQKNNISGDLFAGTPFKVLTDAGPNAAAIFVLHWGVTNAGLSVAAVNDAKFRAAAFYVQDNPKYLVHPPFDATINILGDQPA
jgi:hypothetical protein